MSLVAHAARRCAGVTSSGLLEGIASSCLFSHCHPRRNTIVPSPRFFHDASSSSALCSQETSPCAGPEISSRRFNEYVEKGFLSEELAAGIPFEFCTQAQVELLDVIFSGVDVLAQARRGTGKTLSFLIPAIERFCLHTPPSGTPLCLVIAPTIKDSNRIYLETMILLNRAGLQGKLTVHALISKRSLDNDRRALESSDSSIIIMTPVMFHRLFSISSLARRLANLHMLILDDADRLFYFRQRKIFQERVQKIVNLLSHRSEAVPRQTIIFSETLLQDTHEIAKKLLRPNYRQISALTERDRNMTDKTNELLCVMKMRDIYPSLLCLISKWVASKPDAKIIIFCNSVGRAIMLAELFSWVDPSLGIPIYTLHSCMRHDLREQAIYGFTCAPSALMFASNVALNKLHMPSLTHVVQVGVPGAYMLRHYRDVLTQISYPGRLATLVVLLSEFENRFVIEKLLVKSPLERIKLDYINIRQCRLIIDRAFKQVDVTTKIIAYRAWLGTYKPLIRKLKWSDFRLVQNANIYARDVLRWRTGWKQMNWISPPLLQKVAEKMRLSGVYGLNEVVRFTSWRRTSSKPDINP